MNTSLFSSVGGQLQLLPPSRDRVTERASQSIVMPRSLIRFYIPTPGPPSELSRTRQPKHNAVLCSYDSNVTWWCFVTVLVIEREERREPDVTLRKAAV